MAMQRLTQHKWNKSIWPILLEEADNFSRNSGMPDAGRNNLLNKLAFNLRMKICMIITAHIYA